MGFYGPIYTSIFESCQPFFDKLRSALKPSILHSVNTSEKNMRMVFVCGRMNPPTTGHMRLIKEAIAVAKSLNGEVKVFSTQTHDDDKNPLCPTVKKHFIEQAFGIPVQLTKSPYTALEELVANGGTELTFVIGEDRVAGFQGMADYGTKIGANVVLHSVPRSSESATMARQAVMENDFKKFQLLVPSPYEGFADNLFRAVKNGFEGS